ncbi:MULTISPECIES: NAD(P)H-binding protein [unclassified Rhodococcus (in: high G+C Gram-positive bacteria)]|uniref:NAD(P)H-binding protein n=1 Tax=unclassified Rhodococcus (in: high G+C Gram-positive bacteria) TaxID=192944 RepID=UPI00289BA5DC|nr:MULTISPECIES: NAD(P)H-binding protein [unclassified Rhodococcus (in: high G+C Gram-positive bacteria)]
MRSTNDRPLFLVTGVGSGHGSISRLVAELLLQSGAPVRAMVHRDDGRADALRELGAEIVAGDLTCPGDVAAALAGVTRMFFNMSVSADYLEAAAVVGAIADERGDLAALVNMSQMTVSQMTSTSTEESRHQRLHWLAERILNWSGLPVVHVRPTVFLDNPLFTLMASRSVAERGVLALPFGTGRTSPIAATDVARVVAALLQDPADRVGHVYELTGPAVLDIEGLAEQYTRGLGRPVTGSDLPYDDFVELLGAVPGISSHTVQHLLTVAKLHRDDRYNRLTTDVENVTGQPAQTVEQYIAAHRELFSTTDAPGSTD